MFGTPAAATATSNARGSACRYLMRDTIHAAARVNRASSTPSTRGEVVHRRLRIADAHRLDERGCDVVVRVRSVVHDGPLRAGLNMLLSDFPDPPSRARARRCQ